MSSSEFEDPLPHETREERFHREHADDRSPLSDAVSTDKNDPFVWRDRQIGGMDKYARLSEAGKQFMWQIYRATSPDVGRKLRDDQAELLPEELIPLLPETDQLVIAEYRTSLYPGAETVAERHRRTLQAIVDHLNAIGDTQRADAVVARFSGPHPLPDEVVT